MLVINTYLSIHLQEYLKEGEHKGKVEVGDFFTPSALEKEGQFRCGLQMFTNMYWMDQSKIISVWGTTALFCAPSHQR